MPVPGGGFDQSYNTQAVVATESLLVVVPAVTQAANDVEQLLPMIGKLKGLPKELGRPRRLLADSGYLSEANVEGCAAAGIEPLIALGRERHRRSWRERFAPAPTPPPASATAMQKMRYRLKTEVGASFTRCANKPPNRSSESSNRRWAFASSCCGDCKM
jgi:hypothetical protein